MRNFIKYAAAALISFGLLSCDSGNVTGDSDQPRGGYLDLNVPDGFGFQTTKDIEVDIRAFLPNGEPLRGIRYNVYNDDPLNGGQRMGTVRLSESGSATANFTIPAYLDYIWLQSSYTGVDPFVKLPVQGSTISYEYSPSTSSAGMMSSFNGSPAGISTLGSWNAVGTPDYLTTPDNVSQGFLDRVNTVFVDTRDIRDNYPELLEVDSPRELHLTEDAEVWVTFVGTGAGFNNTLGYYWYEEGNEPTSPSEVQNKTIIFPQAHTRNGALSAGDKVRLEGPNADGSFPAGTYVGWFLIANGFSLENSVVGNGNWTLYGNKDLNTMISDPDKREHLILMYDHIEQVLLMAWEDIRRDNQGSDHDFDDVIFYATWTPLTSVDPDDFPPLCEDCEPEDDDEFNDNYSPAEDVFGTLAFEDLWPGFGDFDMNDLVVDYNINRKTNMANNVTQIDFTLVIRATGAGYQNGFGIELPVPSSFVQSVEGARLTTGSINVQANGTEAGQNNATIVMFDDANYNMPGFANVFNPADHVAEDTLHVSVKFTSPVPQSQLGSVPFNPFVIIDQERGREVHLAGHSPTSLADETFFGTQDDDTDPAQNRFYVSESGLNWAIHVPESIPYPRENVDITEAYLRFRQWAESGGTQFPDWFKDLSGNRDNSKLYIKP